MKKFSNHYKLALDIAKKLKKKGHSVYFVGGFVRDKLLGRVPKEIDLTTSALPDEIIKIFKKTHKIGVAFGIVNVVEGGVNFEVATFRKESEYIDGRRPSKIEYTDDPKLDALRRDFTINSLYYDPFRKKNFDFNGTGILDLKHKRLCTIGDAEKRFAEDYLRILRAVRFGVGLGFKIQPEIIKAIKSLSPKLHNLSKERIRDELVKIFTGPRPDKALQILSDTGILKEILPEVDEMRGIKQPKKYHPEGDVFEHTKLMLSEMIAPTVDLAFSVLLHDVGKPKAYSIKDDVEHFYCHDTAGAHIAEKIMRRLRFPNTTIKNVCFAIKNHMRFAHVKNMRPAKWKAMMMAPTFPMELELHRLDCLCSNKIMDNYLFLLEKHKEHKEKPPIVSPFINGKDLIKLGLNPGPLFGKILKAVFEHQMDGEVKSKRAAISWIKKKYINKTVSE